MSKAKGFLTLADLFMIIKQGSLSPPRNLFFVIFVIADIVLSQNKSAISPPFNTPELLRAASDEK